MKVVKFGASWCAPCTVFAPTFEQAQNQLGFQYPQIEWASWNVDIIDATQYNVHALPTTVTFNDNGEEIARGLGNMPLEELVELVTTSYTESMIESVEEPVNESNDTAVVEPEDNVWQ